MGLTAKPTETGYTHKRAGRAAPRRVGKRHTPGRRVRRVVADTADLPSAPDTWHPAPPTTPLLTSSSFTARRRFLRFRPSDPDTRTKMGRLDEDPERNPGNTSIPSDSVSGLSHFHGKRVSQG